MCTLLFTCMENRSTLTLDCERRDKEYIDFNMICVCSFFYPVC